MRCTRRAIPVLGRTGPVVVVVAISTLLILSCCILLCQAFVVPRVHSATTAARSTGTSAPTVTASYLSSPCSSSHTSIRSKSPIRARPSSSYKDINDFVSNQLRDKGDAGVSRRSLLVSSIFFASSVTMLSPSANADIEGVATPTISDAPATKVDGLSGGNNGSGSATRGVPAGGGVTMFKTNSGLKYIELDEGSGPSPRYGQLVSISYKAYVKLPDIEGQPQKLEQFDSDSAFLIKHGNGRTVPGLDEGVHTMKVGGERRLILPAKLGYVSSGLGPIPESPIGRFKLNKMLDKMVEVKGGNVVFDVKLRSVLSDEADQGYYEDASISPDDFEQLKNNIQKAGMEARAAKAAQV